MFKELASQNCLLRVFFVFFGFFFFKPVIRVQSNSVISPKDGSCDPASQVTASVCTAKVGVGGPPSPTRHYIAHTLN